MSTADLRHQAAMCGRDLSEGAIAQIAQNQKEMAGIQRGYNNIYAKLLLCGVPEDIIEDYVFYNAEVFQPRQLPPWPKKNGEQ